MSSNTVAEYPEPGTNEHIITASRAALSLFPFSGVFLELAPFLPDRLAERRSEFFNSLAADLQKLQEKVSSFSVENLASTDVFAAAVTRVARAADESASDFKRAALRNALLNTAFRIDPDDDERDRFLQLVTDLRPAHLQVLAIVHNPKTYGRSHRRDVPDDAPFGGNLWSIVIIAEPSLEKQQPLANQLFQELMNFGLMEKISMAGMSTGRGFGSRTYSTDTGKRFIEFISTPKPIAAGPRG